MNQFLKKIGFDLVFKRYIVIFKVGDSWLKPSPSLTPIYLFVFFNECGVVNLNWFIKIQQCTVELWTEQTYERLVAIKSAYNSHYAFTPFHFSRTLS